MITRQVRFRYKGDDNDTYFGGILIEDGEESFIICGCCGIVFEIDEIEEIQKYEHWVNISDEIIGE